MTHKPTREELAARIRELEQTEAELEAELEAAKSALNECEDFCVKLMGFAPISLVVIQEEKIVFAAPAAAKLIGAANENEIIGSSPNDWTHPDFVEQAYQRRCQALETGNSLDPFEMVLVRKDNTEVVVLADLTVISRQGSPALLSVFRDMTERRQAQETLREREEQFKTIFENKGTAAGIFGEDSIIRECNAVFSELCGYAKSEIIDKMKWSDFVVKEDLERLQNYHAQRSKDGDSAPVQYECRILTKSGEIRYVIVNISLAGKDRIVSLTDITERKQAEAALRESEEKLRTIIEHSHELFYIHDTRHSLTFVTQTSEDVVGYAPEELMMCWAELTTDAPINQKGVQLTEKAIKTGERQAPYLLELKKKDGTPVLVEIDESPVKDATGKVVAISGAARDVTEQKRIEQKLQRSEKGFRDLFNSITDLIYTQDLEGRFLSFNPALGKLFGYEREELIGKRASEFMEPEWRPFFESDYLGQIMSKGHHNGTTRYVAKNGEKIYIEYRSALVAPEGGEPYISGSGRDVTERVFAQREIKRLQNQVVQSQKMEAIGLMAGGVAHDLNNILSGIVSYPELILMDLPEDSPLRKPLKTIGEAGMRAADVVADLLTIARGIATGKEIVNLNKMVIDYVKSPEFRNLQTLHPLVDFETELVPDLLNIRGSAIHIKKTLMNLVMNATEAIERKGTIVMATENRYLDEPIKGYEDVLKGEYAVLTVSDNGSGIPDDDLERIFEPFYTKKVMGRSGTGLGLAVVWNTVQDHNGYINVMTGQQGTAFELYFPVSREQITEKKRAAGLEEYRGHGEKLLVVDDEESQREIAAGILTKLGYHAQAVSSGEEAVAYVKEHSVDLIVLDMVMPKGMNGRETYAEIIKICPGQKAIIASGYSKTEEVDAAQKLGAGKYIKKPYTLEKIGIAVRDELEKQDVK